MEPIDICYTPLDVPPLPNIDLDDVLLWVAELNLTKNSIPNNIARSKLTKSYPWNFSLAYYHSSGGWQHNFDTRFPELSLYLTSAYGLDIEDIGSIIMLPVKDDHIGLGFWHADPDWSGLRLYLEDDQFDKNPLLFKKSKIPHDVHPMLGSVQENDNRFQTEIHECKILKPTQAFYLNNIRGIHSPFINVPARRFAIIIQGKPGETIVMEKTKDLIIRSAMLYSDYALLY